MRFLFIAFLAVVGSAVAAPLLETRANTTVDPTSISNLKCTSPGTLLDSHSVNVAQLQICGGIAGAITKCQGAPTSTTGTSAGVTFTINPTVAGATINVSKGRWEGCIRAANAVCGISPSTFTCIGGASTGDLAVTLK